MSGSRNSKRAFLALGLALCVSGPAAAQSWPTKPVRLVVSFPPGAPGDVIARLIQPGLQQALGQVVIVDNKPGAGGTIGAGEVARASDGHTFLVGPDTMFTINPHLYRKLTYKPNEDLVPIEWMVRFNQTLVCNSSTGFKTLGDFIAKAKTAPFNYASGGPGVPGHLAMEMLMERAGLNLTHIPYRGPAPATQDVLAGAVPCGFLATPVVTPFVADGRLVALAVSGSKRSSALPNVPTVAEAGIAGFDATFYETLSAPKGTPDAVIRLLHRHVAGLLNSAEVKQKLAVLDLEVVATDPTEAARLAHADYDKWGKVNARVKLQLD